MKKRVYNLIIAMIILSILFSSVLVLAQDRTESSTKSSSSAKVGPPHKPGDSSESTINGVNVEKDKKDDKITPRINVVSKSVPGNLNRIMESDVKIPEYLQLPARVIFGIKENISFQALIILIGVWIMIFVVIKETLKTMSIFKEGLTTLFAGIVITCIIATTGVLIDVVNFFFNSFGFFKELKGPWAILKVGIALIIFIFFMWLTKKITGYISHKKEIKEAENEGRTEGGSSSLIQSIGKMFKP